MVWYLALQRLKIPIGCIFQVVYGATAAVIEPLWRICCNSNNRSIGLAHDITNSIVHAQGAQRFHCVLVNLFRMLEHGMPRFVVED